MGRVSGKVVIVTGEASGLGEADAVALVREGAQVVITDVNEKAGRELAGKIGCEFVPQDVRSEAGWQEIIAHTVGKYGKLDVLVNNAGNVVPTDIETATLEQYRLVHAVHAESTFLGCKYAIAAMKEKGGSIVNMSSLTGIRGYPAVVTYAAAKGAIQAMTIAAHCRAKGYAIRCNAVLPGTIATPLALSVVGDDASNLGQPEDVANTVLFLASDESRHINGAQFVIDNASSVIGGAP